MKVKAENEKKNEIQQHLEKYKNFIGEHKNPLIYKKGTSKYKGSYFSAFEIHFKEDEKEQIQKNGNNKTKEKPKCSSFVNDKDKITERKNLYFKKSPMINFSLFKKNEQITKEDYLTLKQFTDISDFIQKNVKSLNSISKWEASLKGISNLQEIITKSLEIQNTFQLKELTKQKTLIIPIEGVLVSISEINDDSSDCTITLFSDSLNKKIIVK